MTPKRYCVLDFETYSETNLKKVGAFEYSAHPSTEIICAAFKIGTKKELRSAPTKTWVPVRNGHVELFRALTDPDVTLVAHNAFFEQCIVKNVFARKYVENLYGSTEYWQKAIKYLRNIPLDRWLCTASMSRAIAIPGNLKGAAKVLKLHVQKDMEGAKLIKKWCKPRKPTKHNPSRRHNDPEELAKIVSYCATDTEAEAELLLKLPSLPKTERRIWLLDQKINFSGPKIDRPLVDKILSMIKEETGAILKRVEKLTKGRLHSPRQRDATLAWLEENGCFLPDLKKKTVEDALADGLAEGKAYDLLELRQSLAKTSTAKYMAFEGRSRFDGRLRDVLVYHRASTGRWAASGAQLQNLPRPLLEDTDLASEVLRSGDLEWVRALFGDPMSVFSSCIRSMLVAPQNHVFDVADFNAIEARVLFWIAGDADGIQAFREGRDLYRELATKIFSVPLAKVDDKKRFVGKTATLGCGFGMGPKKFGDTCKGYGQEISDAIAGAAVRAYRDEHSDVAALWGKLERAAISAVRNPGQVFAINRTEWFVDGDFLWCKLPSSRKLAYFKPCVRFEPTPWGDKRPVLYHWGEDPKTKQWVRSKTWGGTLTENVVQATARDLMAEAMLRIDAAGPWAIVLSVHDELIAEVSVKEKVENADFCRLMEELPGWAEGCPVKAAGWRGPRFRKA